MTNFKASSPSLVLVRVLSIENRQSMAEAIQLASGKVGRNPFFEQNFFQKSCDFLLQRDWKCHLFLELPLAFCTFVFVCGRFWVVGVVFFSGVSVVLASAAPASGFNICDSSAGFKTEVSRLGCSFFRGNANCQTSKAANTPAPNENHNVDFFDSQRLGRLDEAV